MLCCVCVCMHACAHTHASLVSSSFDYRSDFLAPPGTLFRPACPTCCVSQKTVSMPLLFSLQSWSALFSKLSWACSAALVDSALYLLRHPKGRVCLSLVIPQVLRDHSVLGVSPLSTLHSLVQVASWLADVGVSRKCSSSGVPLRGAPL